MRFRLEVQGSRIPVPGLRASPGSGSRVWALRMDTSGVLGTRPCRGERLELGNEQHRLQPLRHPHALCHPLRVRAARVDGNLEAAGSQSRTTCKYRWRNLRAVPVFSCGHPPRQTRGWYVDRQRSTCTARVRARGAGSRASHPAFSSALRVARFKGIRSKGPRVQGSKGPRVQGSKGSRVKGSE
jgi:hypothetical protein